MMTKSVRLPPVWIAHRPAPPNGVRGLDERLEGPIQKAISFVGQSVHKILACPKVAPNSRLDQWLHDFGIVE